MAQQLATTQAVVEQQVDQVKDDMNHFAKDFQQQLQANAEQLRSAQVPTRCRCRLALRTSKQCCYPLAAPQPPSAL